MGGPLVLDEAVAVAVAMLVGPGQRRVGGRQQRAHRGFVGSPPPALGQQHDKQGGGVDRAVAGDAIEDVTAARPPAELMQDPTGCWTWPG